MESFSIVHHSEKEEFVSFLKRILLSECDAGRDFTREKLTRLWIKASKPWLSMNLEFPIMKKNRMKVVCSIAKNNINLSNWVMEGLAVGECPRA